MLKAQMTVNLPSAETARRMGPLEWLQSLFGKTLDLRSGEDELTMSAFALVQALYGALQKAGITDVIAFLVDKQVIYADADETDDDLDLILRAADSAGLFMRRFTEMHLTLAHHGHGLHTLVDIKIHSHVLHGEDEMVLTLSGRVEELRIAPGESAAAYAERVRAFGAHPETLEAYRLQLDGVQTRLGDALRAAIPGAEIHATPAEVCLVWPDERSVGRFRRLRFGEEVDTPRYRPVPTRQRYGIYNDPYYLYYYDPYYALTNWLLLDTLLHRPAWPSPAIHVVRSDGTPVDVAHQAAEAADAWDSGAVAVDADGALQIADTVPDDWGGADVRGRSSGWDAAFAMDTEDDTHAWGGSDISDTSSSDDASWGGSDVSDSGSSCGSSGDSSSSCGSSCGSSDAC